MHVILEKPEERDPAWTLRRLLSAPTIASKRWAYRQYDSTVRANTVAGPGGDAAVVRLPGSEKSLALSTDCNGRYVYLNPRMGGRIAVSEAARNVACTGARPMAITNCLNFGNPKRPEIFFQFREAVRGMGEACTALETPVTGGNVSLYNESPRGAVYPTPVIGMVGLIEKPEHVTGSAFTQPGHAIVLLGENTSEIGASEYLATIHGVVAGEPPACDPARERRLVDALRHAIRMGLVASAHDCSDGGLAVAIAESCVMDRDRVLGADIDVRAWNALPRRALLFGEAQARIVVSCVEADGVLEIAASHGVPARRIGTVGGDGAPLRFTLHDGAFACDTRDLASAWHDTIPSIMSAGALPSASPA